MSDETGYSQLLSLKLSEVLNDVGVNKRTVLKRRRMHLLRETMKNILEYLTLSDSCTSVYIFGSQTESSTTLGLKSDADILRCSYMNNAIQDFGEWEFGKKNLRLVQNQDTSPGYCLMQCLRDDKPLPAPLPEQIPNTSVTVREGMLLLKNSYFSEDPVPGSFISGHAECVKGLPDGVDRDYVTAIHCKSWPIEARPWLVRDGIGRWPTEEMKKHCETTGCFVVPVSSKSGRYDDLEWRISTSQAERHLMFSLNITQLRCYILMKMILKTFVNPQCDGVLSSFMCKTALFHCVQDTESKKWQEPKLLPCLITCLLKLQDFVRQGNCPHFIIPENNLMAGKISPQNKCEILEILQNIIQSEGRVLLQLPFDDLGKRLAMKMNIIEGFQNLETREDIFSRISTGLMYDLIETVSHRQKFLLREIMNDGSEIAQKKIADYIHTLTSTSLYKDCNAIEISTVKLIAPMLYTSQGSLIASEDINTTHSISGQAMAWFSAGLNSDVASSRLKLASALYCIGDMEKAESVLSGIKKKV